MIRPPRQASSQDHFSERTSLTNPSVLICMNPPRYGFAGLPSAEHVKAFRVVVSVFAVADTRRRETYRKGACGHAWHNLPAATEQPSHRPFRLWLGWLSGGPSRVAPGQLTWARPAWALV
ncbi:DUF5958 family protein [Streptomyces sp. NPDC086182]|uniref:DUF5958 family protein n=1 Tax=Streptomyces sp. NPDC086182 TaxID=3155058 RepID=UPI003440C89D